MKTLNACLATGILALCAGCAVSPEVEERRAEINADIAEILTLPVDVDTPVEPQRCLANRDFRNFRALNHRYMLFSGRGDRHWVNKLRNQCFDLDYGEVLITRSFSSTRICELDKFQVADLFDWPIHRRWPWDWGRSFGTGPACILGKFYPVSEERLEEIEARLEDW